jgi:FkbM family methyltransferase
MFAGILDWIVTAWKEGIPLCIRLVWIAHNAQPPRTPYTLHLRSLPGPFTIRKNTSDVHQLTQTVIRQSYGVMLPETASLIIDAGANIGDTACWYLNRFPTARVVAIEPELSNVMLLRQNVSIHGNRCVVFERALWPRPGFLTLHAGAVETAAHVDEVSNRHGATCTGISVPEILGDLGESEIDILKCDIEGAEEQVFSSDADVWLRQTKCVYVEVHNQRAKLAVLSAATRNGFRCHRYRELYVLSRAPFGGATKLSPTNN